MKRFSFSLERVLAWRTMQSRMERLRWEQIRAELRGIDEARKQLQAEKESSALRMRASGSALGVDLQALDRFRAYVDEEAARLERKRAECEQRMLAQMKVVTAKERDVKVLEHLRTKRLDTWTAELHREIEQQASEAFLARWRPQGGGGHG